MPELPDVEIAKRDLQRWLAGGEIRSARVLDAYIARGSSRTAFARTLPGQTVQKVTRRGKWLRIELRDGARVFSHLGMTGSWSRLDAEAAAPRWERARFEIAGRSGAVRTVSYVDSRRFGRLVLGREDIAEWRELGPDPLAGGLEPAHLEPALGRRRRAIKDVLMDQAVLAGIGNILATEALWIARIDPRAPSDSLGSAQVRALGRALRAALDQELGDRLRGNPDVFSVYGREGEPCPRCKTAFVRIVQAGRSTTFCSTCQAHAR
ncbi:bifunctional DNA-formamidopyrimidine glycosylase/DNA-(apurinic or apyrimidinic site) lyase [Pendulispora rubella]|uniref:Bifunctional DNA-formamidopyrimidine glycosylase/DNA-(Apurinic or apyrimidinic site) lyase n=1 Tax=Pendulispora rubella TaxID=2741070 RepID=A0ABZ2LJ05_9BACT